jgi:hypothetical protein
MRTVDDDGAGLADGSLIRGRGPDDPISSPQSDANHHEPLQPRDALQGHDHLTEHDNIFAMLLQTSTWIRVTTATPRTDGRASDSDS